MRLEGEGTLVRVFIGDSDTWKGHPLSDAIVRRARGEGLAGATVIKGIEGFGASSRIHIGKILRSSADLPVIIELVDTHENIERILPVLDEMVDDGMITLEKIQIISSRGVIER